MNKPELRADMILQRTSLVPDDVRLRSLAVARRAQAAIHWQQVKRLHVYRSNATWGEVDTTWVEAFVYAVWPHIEVTVGDVSRTARVPHGMFDLILVPVVAFDDRLNRLGLGGGWYDRFLTQQPDAVVVGLAYEFQRVSQLAVESHDIKLSAVVTDERIYGRA
jgi:5-formyltetrahydrofolate cyclo-ligase